MLNRGKLFVDKQVQGALISRVLIQWLGLFASCVLVIFSIKLLNAESASGATQHLQDIWNNYALFFALFLLLLPAFAWDTVKLSHRFAGPVVRLRRGLDKLGKGESAQKIYFRDDDFWLDMAESYNNVIDRVAELESEVTSLRAKSTGTDQHEELEKVS